ncbi:TPA: hypothetical protein ACJL6C_000439 [Neisseria meningitidis]
MNLRCYSGLTKIRTRRRSRRQYKQYGTDSLGASAPLENRSL